MGFKHSCCSQVIEGRIAPQWLCNFSCNQTLMSDW